MSETDGVRVLVVDDQSPFRAAARTLLRLTEGFTFAGDAATGEDAVVQAAGLAPDLVLMDLNLPGIDGIEATRRILAAAPSVVVFLCSTYEQADLPAEATTSGAKAYIHKEELAPALLATLWRQHRPEPAAG
jgi:DNA-binding NarL/FixJ family response regulator